jgi:MFS family permease
MFLQYAAPGAVLPLYSIHLHGLGFGDLELACCCATQGAASAVAPLVAGQLADRYVPAERCLGVCALLCGAVLWALAGASGVGAVFALTLLFWLFAVPVLVLGTTVCLTHLPRPERDFGPVRLWGTVGWMVPGWLLVGRDCWPLDRLLAGGGCAGLFRVGAAAAFVLAAFALWLPHTPPRRVAGAPAAPLAALQLLCRGPLAVYAACVLGVTLTQPFTTQATPLLLQQLGVGPRWLGPTLTIAQVTEVVALALLPLLLLRMGVRGTMLLGLGAWYAALTVLSVGRPAALVVGSLGFNGLCVSGFVVAGQVVLNREASGGLRASVQGLLMVTTGVGTLLGHLLVGWLRRLTGGELPQAFAVAAALTGCLLVAFLVGFRDRAAAALPDGSEEEGPAGRPEPAGALCLAEPSAAR